MIGPGKPIDTDRFFVICSNVLGGCMGTTGPMASTNPATGKPYGVSTFPVVTIRDMVRAQAMLLDHLGIETLVLRRRRLDGRHAGAAMGGELSRARVLGDADRHRARHSSQNIAFHEVGRQAVMADPDWRGGRYLRGGRASPPKGLAVARMAAHITYLSDAALHRKFGRRLQDRDAPTFSFDADFQVENYLRHQGSSFVERFDANSYLYITRAMDYFDSRPIMAAAGRRLQGREDALLRRLLHLRLAVSDRGSARHRACAQRRRRARCRSRDRDRQGPRRFPARRAGTVHRRSRAASSTRRRAPAA
jgi:homoserine O-acetyltransferase